MKKFTIFQIRLISFMNELLNKLKIYGPITFLTLLFSELHNQIIARLLKGSYSQNGEDLIIDEILGYKRDGFYVDVGAYDPVRFSNTLRFYKKGWRGINIEPNPERFKKFLVSRGGDINLNIGIGKKEKKQDFYRFIPDTLSTFSRADKESYIRQGYKLVDRLGISMAKLKDILYTYCKDKEIDFVSIDTEGSDLEVLMTNDWQKFNPRLICIETISHQKNSIGVENAAIYTFLKDRRYKRVYKNGLNSIFLRD